MTDVLSTQFFAGTGEIPQGCNGNWSDPTPYMLSALNQVAFRVSLAARAFPYRNTSSPPAPQALNMTQISTINVFHSDYRFLAASTTLSFVCVVLIAPTFFGWWALGRSVSLNPIETAKAFDAPLLGTWVKRLAG